MQIISRQETVKKNLRNQTLHEWMCFESETLVKHNWTDVAVHDRKILAKMRPGETRLWIISQIGSAFLPMYCKLYEKQKQEDFEYVLSSVEIYMLRFFKDDRLGALLSEAAKADSRFYFITKGDGSYDGFIVPTSFNSVMDIVFSGKANPFLSQT